MSRLTPSPSAAPGEALNILLRGLEHLHDRCGAFRIHPQHPGCEHSLNLF
jgi:hypothetical protein